MSGRQRRNSPAGNGQEPHSRGRGPHALSAVLASVLNAFMAALSVKMPTTCCRGLGVSFLPPCLPMSLCDGLAALVGGGAVTRHLHSEFYSVDHLE